MNREILFRGKRTDNGQLVQGYIVEQNTPEYHAYIITDFCAEVDDRHVDILECDIYEVDPSTVGQYTGLTDKSGKRIFEGDVVAWTRDDIRIIGNYAYDLGTMYTKGAKFQVIVNEAGFMLARLEDDMLDTPNAWTKIDNYAFWTNHRDLEVIGNIHDNPELMDAATKAGGIRRT